MENIELKVLSQTGKEVSTITLDKEVFGVEVNEQVMFDAVMTYLANRRQATAKTKKRHEVSGGGKKPFRQKGTGRARAGSSRSPIWVGGGTVFGPDGNQNFKIKQNKKEHKLALKSALTKQVNNLVVLDNLTVEGKTKEVVNVLKALNIANNKVLLVSEDEKVLQGSRNLNNVLVVSKNNISVYDLLNSETLVMVEADVKELEEGLK
ncbi:MAG: 50S ribosomal protein L4 [Candidatus Onthovivens sp.]|nr:50S ribosomal protein L4 [Mollicutes bacterium]MDD7546800.1 50S ribosomal protein L4 [Bacilli bacterium]MDY4215443.1 50S ribosomal protein L4 [Candidatus Onthovivens sp.]MCI7224716.1 50S ribosomal protein L4 [Mollicutes bacterium]MCI7797975.1 50S ribosomal protein L4 [Mollicutes bacterium]